MKSTKPIYSTHEPSFAGNEWKYVKECLDTGWVSTAGRFVDLFERKTAQACGARFAVAVVNGTAALQLALELAGVGPGDEVLVPSLSFIATANAVIYRGAAPHFIDVEEATFGLDPDAVERYLKTNCRRAGKKLVDRKSGRRIAACVPMHAFGHPVRLERLLSVCREFGVPIVEDAAEAVGSLYRGKALGTFGRLGVLSFNGNKIITTGGGGMILTDDEKLATRAKHLSTQAKSDAGAFWHDAVGYNFRLPNINAALGLAQLEQLDRFVEQKRRIAAWYRAALKGVAGVRLLWEPEGARGNFWLNTVIADTPKRAQTLLRRLNEKKLASRPIWGPCHLQKPLAKFPRENLPVTRKLWSTSFNIPSSASLTKDDIAAVAGVIASA